MEEMCKRGLQQVTPEEKEGLEEGKEGIGIYPTRGPLQLFSRGYFRASEVTTYSAIQIRSLLLLVCGVCDCSSCGVNIPIGIHVFRMLLVHFSSVYVL